MTDAFHSGSLGGHGCRNYLDHPLESVHGDVGEVCG